MLPVPAPTDRPATDRGATIEAAWSPTDRPTNGRPTDQATDQSAHHAPASLAARRQAELIRDEWLAPLVAQIREQAEAIGRLEAERAAIAAERNRLRAERDRDRGLADRLVDRLEAERDHAARERDELRAEVDLLRAVAEAPPVVANEHETTEPPRPASEALMLRWRRWLRRMTEGP